MINVVLVTTCQKMEMELKRKNANFVTISLSSVVNAFKEGAGNAWSMLPSLTIKIDVRYARILGSLWMVNGANATAQLSLF